MKYKIIVAQNMKKKFTLYKCNTEKTAIEKFKELIKNNKVLVPRRYVNNEKLIEVNYEILLLKEREETDKNRVVRDFMGRLVEEKINESKWVIVNKKPYFIEEKFIIFGYKHRVTAKTVITDLILNKPSKDMKSIIYSLNKLIIEDINNFDIVVCKNVTDARRLHNVLQILCKKYKISAIFHGLASITMRIKLWKKIKEKTGWSWDMIYRSKTRS